MSTIAWLWTSYRGVTSSMSAALSSLGSGATALAGSALDNSGTRDLYADWALTFAWSAAPASYDAVVTLSLYPSIDGTNYATVPGTVYNQPYGAFRGAFDRQLVASAQHVVLLRTALTPGLQKPAITNRSERGFSTTSNVLVYNTYGVYAAQSTAERLYWSSYAGVVSLLTTELDNLSSLAERTSSAFDNTVTRYTHGDFELVCQYSGAPNSLAGVATVAILPSIDGGSTYPSNAHGGLWGAIFDPWVGGTSAQRQVVTHVALPPTFFKVLMGHAATNPTGGTAPTFVASGNTLRFNAYRMEISS